MRIVCLPAKSPLSASRRLPGGEFRASRKSAASAMISFRRASLARFVGKPFGIVRPCRIVSANFPRKLLIIYSNVSHRDTLGKPSVSRRDTRRRSNGASLIRAGEYILVFGIYLDVIPNHLYNPAVPCSQEGRFMTVANVGRGMRWTRHGRHALFARGWAACRVR